MPDISTYLTKIREAVYGEEVRGSIHDAIQAINTEVDNSEQEALKTSLAVNYSSSSRYNVGDYVFHPDSTDEGTLYRCITPITVGEAWNSAHWKAVTLSEDTSDLRGAIQHINEYGFGMDEVLDNMYIVDASGIEWPYNGWKASGFIKIPEYFEGKITLTASNVGSNDGKWNAFYDSSRTYISNFVFTSGTNEIDVPNNAVYFRLSAPDAVFDSIVIRSLPQKAIDKFENEAMHFIVMSANIASNTYEGHASNLPGNTYCWVSSAWFDDIPSSAGTCWIFTVNDKFSNSFAWQFTFTPYDTKFWSRQKAYSGGAWVWRNWIEGPCVKDTMAYKDVLPNNTDFNDATTIGFYGINSTYTYDHKPSGFTSGYLFTIVYGAGWLTQIAMTLNGSATYVRRRNSSNVWDEWKSGIHEVSAKYFAFGDSTTYGQIGGVGGQSTYNYPACVGKVLGITTINKAVPGQGLITDWSTIQSDFISGLDMTGAKLITVGWAYNDSAAYRSINFGTYDDTGSETFIGKYFTIMRQFQHKCPLAKVILVTGYGTPDGQAGPPVVKPTLETQFTYEYTFLDGNRTTKEMYDTLEAMCHLHGWSCVNQAKGTVFNQWNANQVIGDQIHPSDEGYILYGNHIAAQISSMYANLSTLVF